MQKVILSLLYLVFVKNLFIPKQLMKLTCLKPLELWCIFYVRPTDETKTRVKWTALNDISSHLDSTEA